MQYDKRHGGPWDRGSADAYYWREKNPHYYLGATNASTRIAEQNMSTDELEAYHAGYDQEFDRKDY